MTFDVRSLTLPIVSAPMAGGASTPALASAVTAAGGLGFLAAGYKTADGLAEDIAAVRAATDGPVGVNIFARAEETTAAGAVSAYAQTLAADAERLGVALGEPRFDDDDHAGKVAVVTRERVPVVSFTFGCPTPETMAALHAEDVAVWVTVTSPAEAAIATHAGADALVVQGAEAGGHRAYFRDDGEQEDYGLLSLLRLVSGVTDLPLVATGGLMDGPGIAAVLVAGAAAAQLGSALMLAPEAGTSAPHRSRLAASGPTRLTRAFSGRTARGIVNRFMLEHDAEAPRAYPQVHYLTSPLRAAARAQGDPDAINLWAGQGHAAAREKPAAEIVRTLAAEARRTLTEVAS